MEPLRTHIQKILRAYADYEKSVTDRIQELEKSGHRIVCTRGDSDTWEITDWRTGEVLAVGSNGHEGAVEANRRIDPTSEWRERAAISDEFDIPEATPTGKIPPSLATALEDWIDAPGTPDEEIAAVAGWTPSEVRACRSWA